MINPYDALSPTFQPVPMNIEAEMALLGGLLCNNKAIDRCEGLKAEHFAGENHGAIYAAIVHAIESGHTIDAISLRWQFEPALLTSLVSSVVGIINLTDYARVIREAAEARALIAIGEKLANDARLGLLPSAISAQATRQIDMMTLGEMTGRQWTLDEAMDAALAAMERARQGQTAGISTGFKSFDRRLGGLEPGLVYVIAGRPGMGKSAVGLQIAVNAAAAGQGVLALSLEMSAQQLGRRVLATAANMEIMRLKTGEIDLLDADRLVRARKERGGLPLTIDDAAGQTPAQIAIKARAAKRKHGLGLVMVDHLNLLQAEDHDARNGATWATERASATCLQIAKECECPVLLLAQLNRGVEGREDKRPVLSDLRQAGAIEQDAYAVGFVYRPEYYNQTGPVQRAGERSETFATRVDEWREKLDQERGTAEMIWAKVRDGEPGTDKMRFDGPTATFGEIWS